jgi:general secretion pathway protein I
MGARRSREAGFTLVESVTALFVFAIAAAAVVELNTLNARAMIALERSVYARIVADNQMALALAEPGMLDRGAASGEEALAGRDWTWLRTVAPTPDADIDRVDIVVRAPGEERAAATLTGFRGRR